MLRQFLATQHPHLAPAIAVDHPTGDDYHRKDLNAHRGGTGQPVRERLGILGRLFDRFGVLVSSGELQGGSGEPRFVSFILARIGFIVGIF